MSRRIGVMRSLGQAVGIVVNAIRAPVKGDRTVEVDRRFQSQQQGDVTLRRTVIDEIVWKDPETGAGAPADSPRSRTA
ncbi:MAG: hypothetical protein K8R92_02815 [Planctomycetes bacterium]|nr:hypothetical protein [Planctomycetota bacterium]